VCATGGRRAALRWEEVWRGVRERVRWGTADQRAEALKLYSMHGLVDGEGGACVRARL